MSSDIDWQIGPAAGLAQRAADWDALNDGDGNLPIQDAGFWQIALDCFGTGGESLAVAVAGGQAVAAGLFAAADKVSRNLFQPAQAPLGPWLLGDAWRNHAAGLLPGLKRAFGARCTLVGISQQDPRLHPPPESGNDFQQVPYIQTAAVDISGSFDDYWNARGKNLRQNLRKQRNRLQREGVDTALVTITAAADMARAVDDYATLEQTGWKAGEGTAVTSTGDQGRFYKELLARYAARGEAVAYQYRFGEQLVASDLCLHRDGLLIILKTAYDAAIKKLSPAFLLKEELFQQYFTSQQFRRVEFYGRLMEWHTRWTDDIRELYHLNYLTPVARALRSLRPGSQP